MRYRACYCLLLSACMHATASMQPATAYGEQHVRYRACYCLPACLPLPVCMPATAYGEQHVSEVPCLLLPACLPATAGMHACYRLRRAARE